MIIVGPDLNKDVPAFPVEKSSSLDGGGVGDALNFFAEFRVLLLDKGAFPIRDRIG